MSEFYDELFDVEDIPDYDVDVVFPDGTITEMFLPNKPKVGEILKGSIINKVIVSKDYVDGEFYARVELKRRKE